MSMSRFLCCAAATLLGVAACIKRSERITILADGSTLLQTAIEGDAADLRNGDALPESGAGWTVEERSETDQEGREKLTRTAHRQLAPGQPWPDSYAVAGSDVEELVLHFPTMLTIEQRPGGTYYHFRRVYLRRDHARTAFEPEQILESDEMRELQQKKPEELTPEERGKMADAVLQAHVRKRNLCSASIG
jgi:hypothetical protein